MMIEQVRSPLLKMISWKMIVLIIDQEAHPIHPV